MLTMRLRLRSATLVTSSVTLLQVQHTSARVTGQDQDYLTSYTYHYYWVAETLNSSRFTLQYLYLHTYIQY